MSLLNDTKEKKLAIYSRKGVQHYWDWGGEKYNNYQIINGGLLGTGFQQFELLNSYLSNYDIKKVFVLFIGCFVELVYQKNGQK